MDQTTENKDIEIDLGKIFYKMRDKFIYIIIITIIAAIASGLITHFAIKPKYSATTTMYVYSNTDRISTDSTITSTELTASQDLVNTYIYILKSDTVLEAVIKDLNLNVSTNALKSAISASQADKTVAFEVTVTARSPKMAAKVANSIAKIAPKEIVRVVKAGGVEIIDYAKIPTKPSSPNLSLNVTVAALAGFFISFMAFFLYELFDTTITSERDLVGEFDIPVLGTVPNLTGNSEQSPYQKDPKIVGTKTVNKKSDSEFVLKPSDEILENIQHAKGDDK
ncbi:Wzz/FepE/Etk N-terminal domain-containing protein [uncultured Eubacterium sp.]|uniref:YveK family protein n=1 Tax=uncultured Eubacterium sp. TaxID=165185 RepID=UPI0025F95314|nr:Wzz/FepE/Etk N-terminal domain-containing protein [uncultured Eubacterium sp.]